jgi:hypothetical protein
MGGQLSVEAKIEAMGLYLPEPIKLPPDVVLPFQFVRIMGDRAYVSGHGPQQRDGSLAGPFGKVGAEVSEDEAVQVARLDVHGGTSKSLVSVSDGDHSEVIVKKGEPHGGNAFGRDCIERSAAGTVGAPGALEEGLATVSGARPNRSVVGGGSTQ